MNLAPIVLFVYKRPAETSQTLEALMKNDLANKSTLYIFSDGVKDNSSVEELNSIREVRKIIHSKQWCKEVIIYESKNNQGLANNIINGVTKILQKLDKIIVLEDDLITSKGFLTFMNESLQIYAHDNKVFQISGFMIPNKRLLPTTFFYRAPGSWGWATWRRAWDFFQTNSTELIDKISQTNLYEFNIHDTYNYYGDLLANYDNRMSTWAVKWYASIFLNNGLCLWPSKSLVRNIGHNGTGENCTDQKPYYQNQKIFSRIIQKRIPIMESKKALNTFIEFYQNRELFILNQSQLKRIIYYYRKYLSSLKRGLRIPI